MITRAHKPTHAGNVLRSAGSIAPRISLEDLESRQLMSAAAFPETLSLHDSRSSATVQDLCCVAAGSDRTRSTTANNAGVSGLMAAAISVTNAILENGDVALLIRGTNGADNINIRQAGDTLIIKAGSRTFRRTASNYDQIIVMGRGGNDTIKLQATVTVDSRLYGMAGSGR